MTRLRGLPISVVVGIAAALAVGAVAAGASASELNVPPGAPPVPDAVQFVFVGDPAPGLTEQEVLSAVQRSAKEWNDVTCSTLDVGSLPSVDSLADVPDGAVPIFFVDLAADCFPERESGSQSIGFTVYCSAYPSPSILLNRESYTWRSLPVPFQSVDAPDNPPIVDFASVVTHEMGHALRLGHIDDPIATMFARYRRDGSQATLSAADDLELCALYGGGESECVADAECRDGACLSDGTYGACDTFRGETGDFCSWELLQCGGECFFSSPQTGTGYCTQTCDTDSDCPDRMVCSETSVSSRLCQFDFGPAEPSGCSTSTGAGVSWPLFVVLLAFIRRRRRR
jgi:uncharacterized protein (TIGR03382 family)